MHDIDSVNAGVKAAAHSHLQELPWRGPMNLKSRVKTQAKNRVPNIVMDFTNVITLLQFMQKSPEF